MKEFDQLRTKITDFKERYGRFKKAAFFVCGFLFDALMLDRIDNLHAIIQQTIYILIVMQILKYKTLEQGGVWQPPERIKKWWHYNDEALNFFLGTLLNFYTLFYIVSSSIAVSFVYLLIVFGLLVLNELPHRHAYVLQLKYGLLSLAIFSFLFIIVTISFGFVGYAPFVVALLIGVGLFQTMTMFFSKKNLVNLDVRKNVFWPAIGVAISLLALYALKVLPPIPLSVQSIGIYHGIERTRNPVTGEPDYNLITTRPKWKFWQHGDQSFSAKPGDKIYCFVRIFAPANFKDKIVFHWLKATPNGWQSRDKIINEISGGRDEGFRGYAIKSNYEPGDWRVQIETQDGHEMGRIKFNVDPISANSN